MSSKRKQSIACDVRSCEYNLSEECECSLPQIHVKAKCNCDSQKPEESMCGNYKCKC